MRALSPETPTYIFPAMNTLMYEHPLTAEHIRIVRDVVRYNVVGPIGKGLACGDVGELNASRLFLSCFFTDQPCFQRTRSYDRVARYCEDRRRPVQSSS